MSKHAGISERWITRLKRLLRAVEIDRAVLFAVATRAWQVAAGPVTTLLIAFGFASEVQGVYYTFASLLAMQAVAELGLHWVIIQAASHEWAGLKIDETGKVRGDPAARSRLASLTRIARNWFAAVALLFVIATGAIGCIFFSQRPVSAPWLAPWLLTCLFTGLSLAVSPLIAVLEGCDQMVVVNRYRLQQAVTSHPFVWCAILLGAQLWVVVIAVAVKLFWDLWLTLWHYRAFWGSLWDIRESEKIAWIREIWPLQWRAAVQAPFLYLAYQLFTPVMFYYHGAAVAGAMGMTWSILNILQQTAIVWPQSRAPKFGTLAARGKRAELDRLFFRVTTVSTLVLLTGVGLFSAAVAGIYWLEHPIAKHISQRLLPPAATVVFSLALLLWHVPRCMNIYLRSHKKMPFFRLSLIANSLIAVGVWAAGSREGPLAAGLVLLAVTALVRLPGSWVIWHRCRKAWYG